MTTTAVTRVCSCVTAFSQINAHKAILLPNGNKIPNRLLLSYYYASMALDGTLFSTGLVFIDEV